MRTDIPVYMPRPGELKLAQAAWDLFLEDRLAEVHEINPDLRLDIARDRTIRALGQRPYSLLIPSEWDDLIHHCEIKMLLDDVGTPHFDTRREEHLNALMAREDAFEALCEAACECQELVHPRSRR